MNGRHCSCEEREAAHTSPGWPEILAQFAAIYVLPPLRLAWDLVKSAGRIFPDTWNKFVFRSFWGAGILASPPCFVIDSYEDVRLRTGFGCGGTHPGQAQREKSPDSEIINGTFSPQAAAVLTGLFLRHTGQSLRIATDTELGHTMDATLICYGTSDSNFKTFDVEVSSESDLCQFSFDGAGQRAFRLGGQLYSIENRGGAVYDKAILLKLNSRQNAGNSHVICAGLSEWGSLAAVRYLANNWKTLHKRFDRMGERRDFCVLLEVECGRVENAREIASAVRWQPKVDRMFSSCMGPLRAFPKSEL